MFVEIMDSNADKEAKLCNEAMTYNEQTKIYPVKQKGSIFYLSFY